MSSKTSGAAEYLTLLYLYQANMFSSVLQAVRRCGDAPCNSGLPIWSCFPRGDRCIHMSTTGETALFARNYIRSESSVATQEARALRTWSRPQPRTRHTNCISARSPSTKSPSRTEAVSSHPSSLQCSPCHQSLSGRRYTLTHPRALYPVPYPSNRAETWLYDRPGT